MDSLLVSSLVAGQRAENLGNAQRIGFGSQQEATILQLDVQCEPSASEVVTLWIRGERATFNAPGMGVAPPIVEVEFGTGGTRAGLVELDATPEGCQLSVPASSLRVRARARAGFIGLDAVDVSAFISRGTRAGGCGCPPRRTIEAGPSAEGAVIEFPHGAVSLEFTSLMLAVDARWLDWAGLEVGAWTQPLGSPPPTLAIPSVARSVSLVGPTFGRAIFGVAA
jgi:hypothetical protein